MNWEILMGEAKCYNGIIEYRSYEYVSTVLRCDQSIKSGKIMFDLTFLPRSIERPLVFFVIFEDNRSNYQLSLEFSSNGNISISESGRFGANILEKTNIKKYENTGCDKISVEILGSIINVYKNNVFILSAKKTNTSWLQITVNFEGDGTAVMKNFSVEKHPQKAFIIMDFNERYKYIYSDVVRPVCEELNIACFRADELEKPGTIIEDVLVSIEEADIIIADITPNNENVYFELGYAYALKKKIISLMNKDEREKLPFDVAGYRTIMYENTIAGAKRTKGKLKSYLTGL